MDIQDRVSDSIDTSVFTKCECYNCERNRYNCHRKVVPTSCLQPYHSSVFERNVYVWRSPIHRYGLFAQNRMKNKDIICLYSGERRVDAVEGHNYTCKIKSVTTTEPDFYIDSQDPDNFSGRWANSSKTPNARLVIPLGGVIKCRDKNKFAILVECIRNIEKGDEIVIDYEW